MSLADLLSLVRIPLGVIFVVVAGRPALALTILALSALSDVLDGWAARRFRAPDDQGPHRGDWLDPLCDKVFVAAVVVGIWRVHQPPVGTLLLVLTRELLQGVSMMVYKLVPSLRRGLHYDYRAHVLGKAATVVQFVTGAALVLRMPVAILLAALSALMGAASVGIYLNRARLLARAGR